MSLPARWSWVLAALLAAEFVGGSVQADEPVPQIRLYSLDCGHFKMKDAGVFSDTFEYDGKPLAGIVPCFVIRHPKGTLLRDTGMRDWLAQKPNGVDEGGVHMSLVATLPEELKMIGLMPSDITFVAFSHFHFAHTGNANEFPAATWIINRADTLASMDRIETILKDTKGRLVIQHDPRDFAALPKFPQYLQ